MNHVKAIVLAVFFVAAACAIAPYPRVVTAIEPYTPILPLDEIAYPGLDGQVRCDLQGMPVIYIRLTLPDRVAPMVLHHERVHVAQAHAAGGCFKLRARMSSDSMFRLQMEADAFCSTFELERMAGETPHESARTIFGILSTKYGAAYDSAAVVKAMRCG